MVEPESPSSLSDHRQWRRIFKAMVEMLRSQQSQIETLADDRKFVEDRMRIRHKFWSSRTHLLESQISQMKKEEELGRRVFASKLNLMICMKEREVLLRLYEKQLELAESDLEDFRVCMMTVSAEISELKEKLKGQESDRHRIGVDDSKPVKDNHEVERHIADLKRELGRSKDDYQKLLSNKETEISALLAEKDFMWNQFKKTDSDYIALLKTKQVEVEQANETIEILRCDLEKLQSSANEKDGNIANLEAEQARLQLDIRRYTQEAEQANEKIEKLEEGLRSLAIEKDEVITKLRSDLAKFEMNLTSRTNRNSRFSKDLDLHRRSRESSVIPTSIHSKIKSGQSSLEAVKDNSSWKRKCADGNCSSQWGSGTVSNAGSVEVDLHTTAISVSFQKIKRPRQIKTSELHTSISPQEEKQRSYFSEIVASELADEVVSEPELE